MEVVHLVFMVDPTQKNILASLELYFCFLCLACMGDSNSLMGYCFPFTWLVCLGDNDSGSNPIFFTDAPKVVAEWS